MRSSGNIFDDDQRPIQPAQNNGSFSNIVSRKKPYKPTPRPFSPVRQPKTLLDPSNRLAPLPHLFVCLSELPLDRPELKYLIEWQIKEAWQTLSIIRQKHSSPYHGTIAFSSDPTVLMWEEYQEVLERHILTLNIYKLHVLTPKQLSTLRLSPIKEPAFFKNELMLESHKKYIKWLVAGRKFSRPTIHFPPATQWSKSIYPTKTFAGE